MNNDIQSAGTGWKRVWSRHPDTCVLCFVCWCCQTTQYSVAAQEHLWNSTLTWSVARDELRSATSNTNHCKISVLKKDGTCLGWVVISLRSAKLQGQYKSDPEGEALLVQVTYQPVFVELPQEAWCLTPTPQNHCLHLRTRIIQNASTGKGCIPLSAVHTPWNQRLSPCPVQAFGCS